MLRFHQSSPLPLYDATRAFVWRRHISYYRARKSQKMLRLKSYAIMMNRYNSSSINITMHISNDVIPRREYIHTFIFILQILQILKFLIDYTHTQMIFINSYQIMYVSLFDTLFQKVSKYLHICIYVKAKCAFYVTSIYYNARSFRQTRYYRVTHLFAL